MAITTYNFLDEQGVRKFASEIFGKVNTRIAERIVTSVNETSDDKHVASAKAVYDLITAINTTNADIEATVTEHGTKITANETAIADINTAQGVQDGKIDNLVTALGNLSDKVDGLTHLTIETVVGSIDTVTDPKSDKLYFQKDNDSDTTWMMYIYTAEGQWINVGDTEVDLSNYWTKDDAEAMREALGIHDAENLSDAKITAAVEAAFADTATSI